ncbi:MAG: transposase [Deltaproteobacteria bacterium]|nr:MAG: transposase [Deltaproteobacteria bacterium]
MEILPAARMPRERWSMDFVSDSLHDGRRFRVFTLVDHFTRESPAIEVGNSIPGRRVVAVLERLARTHGLPKVITTDNGTEFTSRAVDERAHRNAVKLDFIRPGKAFENEYIESFNSTGFLHIDTGGPITGGWSIRYFATHFRFGKSRYIQPCDIKILSLTFISICKIILIL